MDETERAGMIESFVSITGASLDNARMCLVASEWNLPAAIEIFYQGDMQDDETADMNTSSSNPAGPSAPSSRPAAKKPTSRIATIGSLKPEDPDSGSEEEGQAFYAGGHEQGGGQQVLGPPRKKKNPEGIIKDVFKSAKEHGAEVVEETGSSAMTASAARPNFAGAGYTLGSNENDSARVGGAAMPVQRQVDVVLKLWRNGFSIDDGELRQYSEEENRQFLDSIKRGEIPQELIRSAQGSEVNLNMEDHRDEEFKAPKKVTKAFAGSGNRLGSAAPEVVAAQQAATESPHDLKKSEDTATATLKLDNNQPTTSLQIRLADGSRLVAKFNHTHKVFDIRRYITTARPQYAASTFALMTTFPNKELKDEEQTITDAQLLNAVIVQRIK